MMRPITALFVFAFFPLACARAPQADAPSVAKQDEAPPTAPQPERGLYGGDPIPSVPGELTSLAFDDDGVLWIGTRYSGLVAFKDDKFTLFDQYNTPLMDCGVTEIAVDTSNGKWIVTERGLLYRFDNSQWKEFPPEALYPQGERGDLGRVGEDDWAHTAETPLGSDTIADTLIQKPGRVWFAGRFAGLHLIDNGVYTNYAPQPAGQRLAWQREPIEDLINQEAVDVDMQEVVKDPRQFANKKLRFKGQTTSSFEYIDMLDSRGEHLHIWPEWAGELSGYLAELPAKNPMHARPSIYDESTSEPSEYLGFLDWGGYFGHVGGWSMEFTIVEQYPADATPTEKLKIKQDYLRHLRKSSPARAGSERVEKLP